MQQNLKTTGVDTSEFGKKADIASLKTTVDNLDKLDIEMFKTVPADLKKIRNLVEKEPAKNNLCNKLVKKDNANVFRLLILVI